jgi:calcineurin-like phosphoesterase family protein
MLIPSENTWLISDTHWFHNNIAEYCRRPANHNELLMDNWRALVAPDDDILHLGDVTFRATKHASRYAQIRDLPGNKFLLRGNHDTESLKFYENTFGFKVIDLARPSRSKNQMQGGRIYCGQDWSNRQIALSHVPIGLPPFDWDINIHGHIHNNGYPEALFKSGRDYRNICVEVVGYKPVRLRDVVYGSSFQRPCEAGIGQDARLVHLQ